ncbi:hypothetical protein JX265_006439 [Neoarthrinium moseri]|uniref:Uncharacterized protein n=1 Tax=Neoarthrinium moseri TaxID=1658444 RepID=A0A9P9WML6_9PEZI|nr:hypothetical protein JX265_006439 [Neoarthrinium moseri]
MAFKKFALLALAGSAFGAMAGMPGDAMSSDMADSMPTQPAQSADHGSMAATENTAPMATDTMATHMTEDSSMDSGDHMTDSDAMTASMTEMGSMTTSVTGMDMPMGTGGMVHGNSTGSDDPPISGSGVSSISIGFVAASVFLGLLVQL